MSLPSSSIQINSLKPTDLRDSSNLLNAEPEPIDDEEARRRREQLNRRPSYRMILKDLETVGDKQLKKEVDETNGDRQLQAPVPLSTYAAATNSNYITTMHSNLTNGNNRQPIRPLEVSAPSPMHAPPLIRPNPKCINRKISLRNTFSTTTSNFSQSGLPRPQNNLILPVNTDILGMKPVSDAVALAASNAAAVSFMNNEWPANLLTAYNSTPSPASVGSNMGGSRMPDHDDSSRKRQVRLLKNREAAKECRRKKKEYVKCLENRVAVLENQNKALIEELKTLKELYCRKEKAEMS